MPTALISVTRIVTGGVLLSAILSVPFFLGLGSPEVGETFAANGYFGIYADGVMMLGISGMIAGLVLCAIASWIMFGGRNNDARSRRSRKARSRRTAADVGNSSMLILGGAGMVWGVLCCMYACILEFWPDVIIGPRLPMNFFFAGLFFTLGFILFVTGRLTRKLMPR